MLIRTKTRSGKDYNHTTTRLYERKYLQNGMKTISNIVVKHGAEQPMIPLDLPTRVNPLFINSSDFSLDILLRSFFTQDQAFQLPSVARPTLAELLREK